MSIKTFRDDLSEEVETILSSDFKINITETQAVPHSGDGAITFPNLDALTQGCKLIETCVLYIDIRRSTELNLTHRAGTVAKLYSAFVRAMTRCARRHNGHVRGIIGDRVMVIFDAGNPFVEAVETAISMNSVAEYVINKHFSKNEVTCGIGIDYGKMLATKTGVRRHGFEQQNYQNLVWLGRPANVASKLTDVANKSGESISVDNVHVASDYGKGWQWRDQSLANFVRELNVEYCPSRIVHKNPYFASFFMTETSVQVRPSTKPILMTEAVYNGYKAARSVDMVAEKVLSKEWFREVPINVPGYRGKVYGGNVIWNAFRD